jgi:hypothetical protein
MSSGSRRSKREETPHTHIALCAGNDGKGGIRKGVAGKYLFQSQIKELRQAAKRTGGEPMLRLRMILKK